MKLDKYDIALVNACGDAERPILQNVCVRDGELIAVNGFILAMRKADMQPEEKLDGDLLLPASMLKQVKPAPMKQANLTLIDDSERAKITYVSALGLPLESEPELLFKLYSTKAQTFPNIIFPSISSLYRQSPTEKKAHVAVDMGLLKKLLACMPNDGILRIGVSEPASPVEFECSSMERPIQALLMPMYVDWTKHNWRR